jgi:hypothetical protein
VWRYIQRRMDRVGGSNLVSLDNKALDEELQSLIGYHLHLQEKVVQALSDSKESQQRVSALLQPWLRRIVLKGPVLRTD